MAIFQTDQVNVQSTHSIFLSRVIMVLLLLSFQLFCLNVVETEAHSFEKAQLSPLPPHTFALPTCPDTDSPDANLSNKIPNALKPWTGWVLHGKERELWCIPRYNDNRQMECLWPSRLDLDLDSRGGRFTQIWQVGYSLTIPLPGNEKQWPIDVTIDGTPTGVTLQNGRPVAMLKQTQLYRPKPEATIHNHPPETNIPAVRAWEDKPLTPLTVSGRFAWKKQPEFLQIPERSAILSLQLNGETQPFPNLDPQGRLWLKKSPKEKPAEKEIDRLKLQVFRLIEDSIPAEMTIQVALDVAGSAREMLFGPMFSPEELIPMSINSPLPAQLKSDGTLRVRAKPGRYTITVKLRHLGPLTTVSLSSTTSSPPSPPLPKQHRKPQRRTSSNTLPQFHWPDHEIWVVNRHSDLRIVEIHGGMPIDPRQTSLPKAWHNYPAFRMVPGEALTFKEIKRGDPVPAPDQLSLSRTLWLHFDGSGYTIQDKITGKKNSDWRLEMAPSMSPGKVSVDGKEQLITRREKSAAPGVALRRGILDLVAEGRFMGQISRVPATGWQHEFQEVKGRLLLPPGWKLIHAAGIDNIPQTWLKRWSLLDFFIVLIFTIAVAKLYSRPLAAIGFITLVLIWHDPMAPRFIWLYLLAGFALLKYLPEKGRFRKAVKSYQSITVLVLLFIGLPYAVHALRVGIYPQLERPWFSMNDGIQRETTTPEPAMERRQASPFAMMENAVDDASSELMTAPAPAPRQAKQSVKRAIPLAGKSAISRDSFSDGTAPSSGSGRYGSHYEKSQVMQYDPKSLTQTGPGLPVWDPFQTISFSWSGPVAPGQTISFHLTGPLLNGGLAFVRVGLIIALTAGLFGAGFRKGSGFIRPDLSAFTSIVATSLFSTILGLASPIVTMGTRLMLTGVLVMMLISGGTPHCRAGEIPSQQLLDELRDRLLEPAECFPSCADLSEMEIDISNDRLTLTLHVDAVVDTAIPLPGHARHWLPSSIQSMTADTLTAPPLFRENEILWMGIDAGRHRIRLEGPIRTRSTFQLPLPMPPRHHQVNSDGWDIQGIQPDGTIEAQIQFKRLPSKASGNADLQTNPVEDRAGEKPPMGNSSGTGDTMGHEEPILPGFARVERRLMLGLVWKVETRVIRTTPSDAAMMLAVPLLPNESVITRGVRVTEGKVQVSMAAGRNHFSWDSFLDPTDTIQLTHADTRDWTERWTVDVSPIFHVETAGIPVILHQVNHRWYPTWHPWPRESVTLTINRPAGVEGNTLTIESSRLELRPGRHSSSATLTLKMKSSRGGQHTIELPEDTELQEVRVNGKVQLIRQEGRKVPLPVSPGSQTVHLTWRGSEADAMGILYRTPPVDLGLPSVNAAVDLHFPRDRWPLALGGEQLIGPAVLFWSVILIIFLGAVGLSMTGLTPLKFHHWFLLGIGMSMNSIPASVCVVAWLVLMDLRKKADPLAEAGMALMENDTEAKPQEEKRTEQKQDKELDLEMELKPETEPELELEKNQREMAKKFNLIQFSLAGLTLLALISLFIAISQGLIGHPDMNIVGNGSSSHYMRWYQDISEAMLPRAWVFSMPMLVYRGAMLTWALWIAFALVFILKWGWNRFAHPVLWVSIPKTRKKRFGWQTSFSKDTSRNIDGN